MSGLQSAANSECSVDSWPFDTLCRLVGYPPTMVHQSEDNCSESDHEDGEVETATDDYRP
jgi:hypothetical protein